MSISVVVVTWNGLHLLRPCVAALRQQTLEHDLVVVDNGSSDGTAQWVRAALPSARLVSLPANLGFAGGNNAGLRAASGDLLVLLNNDTVAPPSFLEELVRPFEGTSRLGAAGGVLTFAHRPELVASAGIAVGRDGVHRDARALTALSTLPDTPEEIFGGSGGAICLRRAALLDVGLFEDGFFNYLEDADLAWRLRLRGWHCVLAPRATVRHIYSATSGYSSPTKQHALARNRWRVLVRCFPAPLLRSCARSILRYDLLAVLYGAVSGKTGIVKGRIAALREMPRLVRQRRVIQQRRTAGIAGLARWIEPAPPAAQVLLAGRELDRVLRDRQPAGATGNSS